jgi:hypothetical protein
MRGISKSIVILGSNEVQSAPAHYHRTLLHTTYTIRFVQWRLVSL